MIHSLCESCKMMREVVTPRGSRFLLCQLSQTRLEFAKYPAQPVVRCEGHQPIGGPVEEEKVVRLYQDPWFTFRFAEDRLIGRFHLEGMAAGARVSIHRIDATGERVGLVASATVREGGWVELQEAIVMRAGEGFVVTPEEMV